MTERGSRKSVYILESDAELAQLMARVLCGAGYRVRHGVPNPDATRPFGPRSPDLLIVTPSSSNAEKAFLAELRGNTNQEGIPVLAIAPAEHLAAGPLSGYSALGTLQMPFDLDDFLAKVDELLALPHPSAETTTVPEQGALASLAASVLGEDSRAAVFRWVQRLRQESPWRERADLKLYEMIDNVPLLVEAIVAALKSGSPDDLFAASPDYLSRVRDHAELRRRQGFSPAKVIHEYAVLRDELLYVLWERLPSIVPSDEVLFVSRAFELSLDRVVEQTVAHYFALESQGASLPQR